MYSSQITYEAKEWKLSEVSTKTDSELCWKLLKGTKQQKMDIRTNQNILLKQ